VSDHDEQQYEVGFVIRDTTLIWASSPEEANDKARKMGYNVTSVEELRELPEGWRHSDTQAT
jgi:hypothetical protein